MIMGASLVAHGKETCQWRCGVDPWVGQPLEKELAGPQSMGSRVGHDLTTK